MQQSSPAVALEVDGFSSITNGSASVHCPSTAWWLLSPFGKPRNFGAALLWWHTVATSHSLQEREKSLRMKSLYYNLHHDGSDAMG